MGVFGFIVLSLMMISLFFCILFGDRRLRWLLLSIFVGFFVLQLFDHYMWDIWQGQLLFGLMVGLLVVMSQTGQKHVAEKR